MSMVIKTFPVSGMSCASCAVSVESILNAQPGVSKAVVNFPDQSTLVEYDPSIVDEETLKRAVEGIGYELIIEEVATEDLDAKRKAEYEILRRNTIGAFVFSVPVFILGMFFHRYESGKWISMFLSLPVLLWFGKQFFINALKQAKHGKATMDTLVALSTFSAFSFSAFNTLFPQVLTKAGLEPHVYFEAAAVVITFILLGRLLEEGAKSKTSSALKKLIGLQAKTVIVILDNKEVEIKIEAITKGTLVLIKPGAKIPVDGTVLSGDSYVDESMINGEPVPALKNEGTKVFSGTINQKGILTIKADKVGKETVLAQIIETIKEAQSSKAPVQRLVDKVAGVFVPIVMILSVLTFLLWISIGGTEYLAQAFLTSITVLIIACPCALGLATPTAIMTAVGKGAENGILIKDAETLEQGQKIDTVVLDKTGTITEGKPSVTDTLWLEGLSDTTFYKNILYVLERKSEHPLAKAIAKSLETSSNKSFILSNFKSVTGKGIQAMVEGQVFLVGNALFLQENGIALDNALEQTASTWKDSGKTVIYFANKDKLLAIIALTDKIKENSSKAIKRLQEKGIQVFMLTGDNKQTAKAVAQIVGISDFRSEAMPSEKADFIKKLQAAGKTVAMVGDGINDSEALATADLGVAMAQGSDIAIDVAPITLMNSDLNYLLSAFKLSATTIKTIRQNLFWAFIYNLIGIPIAAGILYPFNGFLLNPMLAGAAMALSSVSVVSNSLRLKIQQL